jgi:hypothetical protein
MSHCSEPLPATNSLNWKSHFSMIRLTCTVHSVPLILFLEDVQSSIRGHSHNSGSNGNDEEAAALIVRHFERLKGQWHGVLQEAVYER